MPTRPSPARWLEPFAAALWPLFLVWTVLIGLVWATGFGEAETATWVRTHLGGADPNETGVASPLQDSLDLALRLLDPLWIILATGVSYMGLTAEIGLVVARRWFLATFVAALFIAALSSATAWPLGPVRYTDRLGPRLAHVPLGWPLLWCTVIFSSRGLLRQAAPRAAHWQIALGVGLLAMLTDLNLEPIAWKARAFWLWFPAQLPAPSAPPLQNSLTWLVLAALLTYLFRAHGAVPKRRPPHPVVICSPLLLLNALLLLARLPGR